MKAARFVLKIVALALAAAALACAIIAYWDRIADFFGGIQDKLEENRHFCRHSEYDDYADWDE
jgi:hypothetical protein